MQVGRSLAIDLPQTLLVIGDDGAVTVMCNDPAYLANRHDIEGEDRLETVSDAPSSLAAVAAGDG